MLPKTGGEGAITKSLTTFTISKSENLTTMHLHRIWFRAKNTNAFSRLLHSVRLLITLHQSSPRKSTNIFSRLECGLSGVCLVLSPSMSVSLHSANVCFSSPCRAAACHSSSKTELLNSPQHAAKLSFPSTQKRLRATTIVSTCNYSSLDPPLKFLAGRICFLTRNIHNSCQRFTLPTMKTLPCLSPPSP